MQKEMMTLSAALATGRPFKHKNWIGFMDTSNGSGQMAVGPDIYEPVWQVQEEEKPPMRVFTRSGGGGDYLIFTVEHPKNSSFEWTDCTEDLAKALAPLIKKELNL